MVVSRRSILYPVTYSGTTNTFALHEVSLYKNETAKYIANELSMLHSLYSTPMPINRPVFLFLLLRHQRFSLRICRTETN